MSREATRFMIHQVGSTLGVIVLSGMSCYESVELLKLVRVNVTTQAATSLLLGVPGFPFHGAVGFFFGFGLARFILGQIGGLRLDSSIYLLLPRRSDRSAHFFAIGLFDRRRVQGNSRMFLSVNVYIAARRVRFLYPGSDLI